MLSYVVPWPTAHIGPALKLPAFGRWKHDRSLKLKAFLMNAEKESQATC